MFRNEPEITNRLQSNSFPIGECYTTKEPSSKVVNEHNFEKVKRCCDENYRNRYHENLFGGFTKNYTPVGFQNEINSLLERKLKEYDNNVQIKRERLRTLFAQEEYEQLREIVENSQRSKEQYLRDVQIRTKQLKAQRENERQEIVKEKKLQQYIEKCEEFRPILENLRLKEIKEAQKIQIKERELEKENEKQINHIWYELLMKDIKIKDEREERNNLEIRRRHSEYKSTWDIQCQKRELERQDKLRETREEAIKLNNLKEEIRKEEIAELDAKRRKRDQCYREIMAQIKEKQEALQKKIHEDKLLQGSYNRLQEEEMEREKDLREKERIRQEMDFYNEYILRLNQERNDEERRLDELIQQELKNIQDKQDEARNRYQKAKANLEKAVLEGRKEQIIHKKEEAEQQLKMKQAENQILEMARDQNERLSAENKRKQILAAQQYREELNRQIEEVNFLREQEKGRIENHLLQGQMEEEEYKQNLIKILNTNVKISEIHPFRKVVKKDIIPCAKNLYY